MGFKKILSAVSPIASVINKSGPVAKLLGMRKSGSTGDGRLIQQMVKDGRIPTALEEGKARITPLTGAVQPGMKKGGMVKKGYHKMPDGKMMKGKSHKSTASKRADGICVKGKTRGRMC